MLRRMQVSLSGLLEQLEKYRIESEFLLVDWNSPPDKPPVKDVVAWPRGLRYCTVRVIEVPPSIHRRYRHHKNIPMHATVAVNSGIRRARGEFILPGTIDLLYSNTLASFIGSKSLKGHLRYRTDRCDVNRAVLQCESLTEQLDYCDKNIIHIHALKANPDDVLPPLHTNACGDFQLMSRHYWHLLRGYREAEIASAFVDGLLSYASYTAGVTEVVLGEGMKLYHIDHDDKFSDRLKVRQSRFEELMGNGFIPHSFSRKLIALWRLVAGEPASEVYRIPTLSFAEYRKICAEMIAGKRSYIFNDESWGLGRDELKEALIAVAEWDHDWDADTP